MICCRWLSAWRCCSWVLAVCVMWTAAAGDDQVPFLPTPVVLHGDWPDSSISQDSLPTPSPTQQNRVGAGAGTHIGKETASTPRTVQAATVPASTTATTITASAAHVNPSFPPTEEVLKAQRTSASRSSMASSTPVAAPTPRPSSTEKPIQPTYSSPASPPQQPTLLPSYSPPMLVEVTGARKVEDGVRKMETEPEKESLCDFDPCVHLQQPCPEVKEVMGWSCRCPGLTADPFVTPAPVTALQVMRVWPRAASVQWCAPYSALSAFQVWVLRQDGSAISNGTVSSSVRQTTVFGLEAGHAYTVCVSVLNGASVSRKRCVSVATPQDVKAIGLYVLTGGCAVLLLMAVVLSVCLYRQCKRGQMLGTNTFNPTMQTLHDPRLTSLVSISNPAYAHSDEQTSAGNTHYTYRAQP